MADQIAAPHLVGDMAKLPASGAATVLAVDRDLSRVFDFDDATKVRLAAAQGSETLCHVTSIGKDLPLHDAVSAGSLVMSPSLLACLDTLAAAGRPR